MSLHLEYGGEGQAAITAQSQETNAHFFAESMLMNLMNSMKLDFQLLYPEWESFWPKR
jgi:hypothetical protein